MSPLYRPAGMLPTGPILTLALATALVAGCGSAGDSATTSASSSAATSAPAAPASSEPASEPASESAPAENNPAEAYLRKSTEDLTTVLNDYKAGKKDQALELAKSLGEHYEGVPEETVAKLAPAVNRQFDPLIEATLPGAIERGADVKEVTTLVGNAQKLIAQALQAVEENE